MGYLFFFFFYFWLGAPLFWKNQNNFALTNPGIKGIKGIEWVVFPGAMEYQGL